MQQQTDSPTMKPNNVYDFASLRPQSATPIDSNILLPNRSPNPYCSIPLSPTAVNEKGSEQNIISRSSVPVVCPQICKDIDRTSRQRFSLNRDVPLSTNYKSSILPPTNLNTSKYKCLSEDHLNRNVAPDVNKVLVDSESKCGSNDISRRESSPLNRLSNRNFQSNPSIPESYDNQQYISTLHIPCVVSSTNPSDDGLPKASPLKSLATSKSEQKIRDSSENTIRSVTSTSSSEFKKDSYDEMSKRDVLYDSKHKKTYSKHYKSDLMSSENVKMSSMSSNSYLSKEEFEKTQLSDDSYQAVYQQKVSSSDKEEEFIGRTEKSRPSSIIEYHERPSKPIIQLSSNEKISPRVSPTSVVSSGVMKKSPTGLESSTLPRVSKSVRFDTSSLDRSPGLKEHDNFPKSHSHSGMYHSVSERSPTRSVCEHPHLAQTQTKPAVVKTSVTETPMPAQVEYVINRPPVAVQASFTPATLPQPNINVLSEQQVMYIPQFTPYFTVPHPVTYIATPTPAHNFSFIPTITSSGFGPNQRLPPVNFNTFPTDDNSVGSLSPPPPPVNYATHPTTPTTPNLITPWEETSDASTFPGPSSSDFRSIELDKLLNLATSTTNTNNTSGPKASVSDKKKFFEKAMEEHHQPSPKPEKVFSFLSQDEVEKMKQEEERKIASLSRSELKNWNREEDPEEDDVPMEPENEKRTSPQDSIGSLTNVHTAKAERRMKERLKQEGLLSEEDAELTPSEQRALRAEQRAAWRQARLKSLEQDALQAQMVIKKMNEMIDSKGPNKDEEDCVKNNIALNNNEPLNPLPPQDHQNNIQELLRPSSDDFPKLSLRQSPGPIRIKESERVLGETVTVKTEEYVDEVSGERKLRTIEIIEKLIEKEVETTKEKIVSLELTTPPDRSEGSDSKEEYTVNEFSTIEEDEVVTDENTINDSGGEVDVDDESTEDGDNKVETT